jgi:hypothetical protein
MECGGLPPLSHGTKATKRINAEIRPRNNEWVVF